MHFRQLTIFLAALAATIFTAAAQAPAQADSAATVVFLGDSNTWIGGDDCSKPRGWNHAFAAAHPQWHCRSYARSGATWANTPRTRVNTVEDIGVLGDDNVVYNQTIRLADAIADGSQLQPDIIFISAGANDAWFASKRPQALSQTPAQALASAMPTAPDKALSIAQSVRLAIAEIRKTCPDARIVLLTPFHMKSVPQARITAVGEMLEDCAAAYSLEYVRQDIGSGIDGRATDPATTYDGNHTNELGARILAEFIDSKIKR